MYHSINAKFNSNGVSNICVHTGFNTNAINIDLQFLRLLLLNLYLQHKCTYMILSMSVWYICKSWIVLLKTDYAMDKVCNLMTLATSVPVINTDGVTFSIIVNGITIISSQSNR